jgi:(p)ppGpp synthase/HD superfamily hydrolase
MKTPPSLYTSHTKNPKFVMAALDYAEAAHGDQKRKYTGEPYFNHCHNVAALVSVVTADHEVISAAALHDVVEDTPANFNDILAAFGPRVAQLVMEVTDVSTPQDGNRRIRKAIDLAHIAKSSPDGATIKLADICDNTADILEHDEGFSRVYLVEKWNYLQVLSHGNADLYYRACDIVRLGMSRLGIAHA